MSKRRRGVRPDPRQAHDENQPFSASGAEGLAYEPERTAGQMLRGMREAAGIDAALVASALKVTPQKIDALEGGRYEELPDMTFARGLAAAFCRAFGEDPAPVLARMPAAAPGLHATGNTNQPMQGHDGEAAPTLLPRPLLWAVLALLLIAAAIWLLPAQPGGSAQEEEEEPPPPFIMAPEHTVQPAPLPEPPASEAEPAEAAASAASAASAAVQPASAAASAASRAAASDAVLEFEALDRVWAEVVDASGRKRLSRNLDKGERVSFGADVPRPLKVSIGRREAMRVTVRGEPYEPARAGSGSVARFQVK